ncbi:MAG: CHAD domain-containing protein [Thermoanaerobaculia bacterium]
MSTNPAAPRLVKRQRRRTSANKLSMRRGVPLREAVLGGFTRILAHARSAARRACADPIESVHDFRKSVRRARAVVSLLRPSLGKTAAAGITGELRRAFGPTGELRDTHILLETLREVPSDDPARDPVLRALEEEPGGDSAPAGEALRAGSRILQPLPGVLGVTLPRAYSMEDLARGIARGWRRTRRALERAASTGLDADFHEWRKRVKELRYQVELLASTGSAELKRQEKALSALAEELGRVTDLIVLRSALASRQERGSLPAAPGLMESIRSAIGERSRELLARGREAFAEPHKEFARRVLAERG